ncbi:MFS transporter [Pedobacter hiemivivus]|jgi:MFS family permease|uniref:MFS transporter n=1 Tax=Pedobacter hiemivivus TaxID=2530454 RepID=A0A4U1G023_9SPHI|nr:MFS transporter [Pedobacter hiemivivus]TCC91099.1 MFS transporter [Pedobacter hiemivivus]TKC55593.1 MFS transporter [Pedobacter hiemivivus]
MTNLTKEKSAAAYLFSAPVIVASLGYFVDIYDLLLFGIVRIPSLTELGLNEAQVSIEGASILNWQMTGLLLGGILWGVLGDKKGRLSVLFGSIITYSVANFACGFVHDVTLYKLLRFIAGIGLAGELGAGITLVSESLPKRLRAIGTSVVAGVGLMGAVAGYFTVEMFSWRNAYFIGGGMGILLLFLRIGVFESGMFHNMKEKSNVAKGNFLSFFTKKSRLILYLKCIGIGLPTWYVIGILATFSNEFGKALGIAEDIKPGLAVMWCYVGLSAGDLVSGVVSYWLESRIRAVTYMMIFTAIGAIVYLYGGVNSTFGLYGMCLWVGFGIGYWAMFVTIGAEQFGTNVRATAATTIPNMVRGTVVLMTTFYTTLKPIVLPLNSAALLGLICFGIGFYCIRTIPETHHKDLDFIEED